MKVYSALGVFAAHGIDSYVLTTAEGGIPKWELTDYSDCSLVIAQKEITKITGISSSWHIQLRQSGFFENSSAEKIAVVVYTTYFPAKQSLTSDKYKWSKLSTLSDNDEFNPVLRYLAAQRS